MFEVGFLNGALPGLRDVEVTDERGIDPALIGTEAAERVVLGEDQARTGTEPAGHGRHAGGIDIAERRL